MPGKLMTPLSPSNYNVNILSNVFPFKFHYSYSTLSFEMLTKESNVIAFSGHTDFISCVARKAIPPPEDIVAEIRLLVSHNSPVFPLNYFHSILNFHAQVPLWIKTVFWKCSPFSQWCHLDTVSYYLKYVFKSLRHLSESLFLMAIYSPRSFRSNTKKNHKTSKMRLLTSRGHIPILPEPVKLMQGESELEVQPELHSKMLPIPVG